MLNHIGATRLCVCVLDVIRSGEAVMRARAAHAHTRAMNIHRGINCRPADCDGQNAQRTLPPQPTAAAADAVCLRRQFMLVSSYSALLMRD